MSSSSGQTAAAVVRVWWSCSDVATIFICSEDPAVVPGPGSLQDTAAAPVTSVSDPAPPPAQLAKL